MDFISRKINQYKVTIKTSWTKYFMEGQFCSGTKWGGKSCIELLYYISKTIGNIIHGAKRWIIMVYWAYCMVKNISATDFVVKNFPFLHKVGQKKKNCSCKIYWNEIYWSNSVKNHYVIIETEEIRKVTERKNYTQRDWIEE